MGFKRTITASLLIGFDHDALNAVVKAFNGSLFSYLRHKAKYSGGKLYGANAYLPGGISFIQRFGSSLNLNVHIHAQVSDGVYMRYNDDELRFLRVGPPTLEEIEHITKKIALRVHRYLEKRMSDLEDDELLKKEPLLAKCYAASIRYLGALGKNSGKPLTRVISSDKKRQAEEKSKTIYGYNLHASQAIESFDRAGLERSFRYMGRPPLSRERLRLAPDGRNLIVKLKGVWRDGTTEMVFTPFQILERLVALIPPPRKNLVRYHGVFAPNAKYRKEIALLPKEEEKKGDKKIRRPNFARLMARVFDIDVLQCPKCGSRMQTISFIKDPKVIRDILSSLKMSTAPPEEPDLAEYAVEYDESAEGHYEEY